MLEVGHVVEFKYPQVEDNGFHFYPGDIATVVVVGDYRGSGGQNFSTIPGLRPIMWSNAVKVIEADGEE